MNRSTWLLFTFLLAGCTASTDDVPEARRGRAGEADPRRVRLAARSSARPATASPPRRASSTAVAEGRAAEGLGVRSSASATPRRPSPAASCSTSTASATTPASPAATPRPASCVWKFEYPTDYEDLYGYDPGPRACPVVDGDRVYVHGAEGMLALRLRGRRQGGVEGRHPGEVPLPPELLRRRQRAGGRRRPAHRRRRRQPEGAAAGRPPRGEGRTAPAIVAFDKKTGAVKYRAGDELASYASPVVATIDGKRIGLYFARGGLLGFDPQTGKATVPLPVAGEARGERERHQPGRGRRQGAAHRVLRPGAALLEAEGREAGGGLDRRRQGPRSTRR